MQTYEGSFAGAGNVVPSGSTQPMPVRGEIQKNPGGPGGTNVVGANTPVVVATGAENNG